eukprot:7980729-Heterocapsa_arctica.AAC.1
MSKAAPFIGGRHMTPRAMAEVVAEPSLPRRLGHAHEDVHLQSTPCSPPVVAQLHRMVCLTESAHRSWIRRHREDYEVRARRVGNERGNTERLQ